MKPAGLAADPIDQGPDLVRHPDDRRAPARRGRAAPAEGPPRTMNETRRWSVAEAEGARCSGLTTWASLRPFSAPPAMGECPILDSQLPKALELGCVVRHQRHPSARMRRDDRITSRRCHVHGLVQRGADERRRSACAMTSPSYSRTHALMVGSISSWSPESPLPAHSFEWDPWCNEVQGTTATLARMGATATWCL
jgi:hypothetical protein